MDLYNTKTREKEEINDPDELQQALASKSHGFQSGTQIPAINPYGEHVFIPADRVHDLVAGGYKIPTQNELAVEKFVEANKGPLGAFGVFGAQAADEFLGGTGELIFNKTASPLAVAKKEALKKEHDYGNLLGGLIGGTGGLFFGPMARLFGGASKIGQATTKRVAEKLGVESAGVVGQRGINQAARDIVAKTVGMGAEGGIIAAPHAITEALLGDPIAASEHLLAGVGIGSFFGAGLGASKELFGLTKKIAQDVQQQMAAHDLSIKKLSRQMAKVWTGVPEEKFAEYLNHPERVNAADTNEKIYDEINTVVSGYRSKVDNLKIAVKEKEQELNQTYRNARRDLEQARTPQTLADEIALSVENLKPVLGAMSKEADDILANTPGGISPDKMIGFLKYIKSEAVPVMVGEKAKTVALKLDHLIDDIQTNLRKPKQLSDSEAKNLGMFAKVAVEDVPFPTVRDIIQQVRDDIDWTPLAAAFNTRLNKANKSFTERLSDLVKKKSPEYADKMAEMKKIADLHEEMLKVGFGDRRKGAALFDRIAKSKSEIDSALISKYDSITGSQFKNALDGFKKNRDLLEQSARRDMRSKFVPKIYADYQSLQNELKKAEQVFKPMSTLTPERILPAMKNLDRKKPDLLVERAIQYLDGLKPQNSMGIGHGYNFRQRIDDRNILDMFQKENRAGSRLVNLSTAIASGIGGAIGLGTAGPAGLIAGSMGGAVADIYGGQILKGLVDKFPSMAGLLFVEQTMKKNAQRIDEIPSLLQRMSKIGSKNVAPSTLAINSLYRVLQSTDTGKENPKKNPALSESAHKISEIYERVSELLSDPYLLKAHLEKMTQGLTEGGAPGISSDFIMKAQQVLQYIAAIIPKPPSPTSPFQRRIPWKPADYEIYAFAQKLQVLEDPLSVLDFLENGSLTQNHMEALNAIYPQISQEIRKKVTETAMSGEEIALDYDKRIKLSLLLGVPIDTTLTPQSVNYFQSGFLMPEVDTSAQPNPTGFKADISDDYATQRQTQFQNLENMRK